MFFPVCQNMFSWFHSSKQTQWKIIISLVISITISNEESKLKFYDHAKSSLATHLSLCSHFSLCFGHFLNIFFSFFWINIQGYSYLSSLSLSLIHRNLLMNVILVLQEWGTQRIRCLCIFCCCLKGNYCTKCACVYVIGAWKLKEKK